MSEEEIKAALSISIKNFENEWGQQQIDVELLWHDEILSIDCIVFNKQEAP